MNWKEHEQKYCVDVEPPEYAESFDTYIEACGYEEFRELTDYVGGFHPISKFNEMYWVWRE